MSGGVSGHQIILLVPDNAVEAQAAAQALHGRIADATGTAPALVQVSTIGAPTASDFAAVQAADLAIVMGRSPQIEVLAGLAALKGTVVEATGPDHAVLNAAIEERLKRPGLAGWLTAADAGPVALVDWARANPADPLARSAALGMTPAEHRALVLGPAAAGAPAGAAQTPGMAQVVGEPSASDSLAAAGLGAVAAPPKVAGERWERLAVPLLVAALSAVLLLAVLLLGDWSKAADRQFLMLFGTLAALTSGLVAWRWPIPTDKGGRAAFVLRYMAIAGGLMTVALCILFFSRSPEDLVGWFGSMVAIFIAGFSIVFSLVLGAIGMLIGRAAHRAARLDTLAFVSLAVVVAAAGIGVWQSFLFLSEKETIDLLDAQLARTGNDVCSTEAADQTLAARVRVAERALGREPTGLWSSDLMDALEAKPAKSTFILAADGSGDGRTVPEIAGKLCRLSGDVRIDVMPGSYDLTEDDKFRLSDGDMRINKMGLADRRLVIVGSSARADRPVFALRGLAAFGFNPASGWATVAISDIVFEDRPALSSTTSEPYDKVALYLGVPAELKRVSVRAVRQAEALGLGYEADRSQPMLLSEIDVRNGEGPALTIEGENVLKEVDGKPLPPFDVRVTQGTIFSQAHNPVTMTGPARLDIRDTRISAGNRNSYCIALSGGASYSASGLTMECAGSPRGMTAAEQGNAQ